MGEEILQPPNDIEQFGGVMRLHREPLTHVYTVEMPTGYSYDMTVQEMELWMKNLLRLPETKVNRILDYAHNMYHCECRLKENYKVIPLPHFPDPEPWEHVG